MAGETVAYWILSSLVVLAAAVSTAHGDWVSDSWIHLGAIHEMSRDFWSPVEPLVGEDVPFPYFSPWTAVGALGVRLFSVTPFQVLAVFAVVSPLVLVHSLHRLVRAVSPAPWAPVAVLAALLTVWGPERSSGADSSASTPSSSGPRGPASSRPRSGSTCGPPSGPAPG